MSVTHLAGPTITIGKRIIQRCSICGDKLCDNINTSMPIIKGSATKFPTWETGRLVQIEEGNPKTYSLLDDTDKLPDDSCINLVE
jgi:hypothetical protein